MAKVSFKKSNKFKSFEVVAGMPLMAALLSQGIPVASSCLGDGVCSKCRIRIVGGQENLSSESALEKELRAKNKITESFRISCQTKILGDITVDTDYW